MNPHTIPYFAGTLFLALVFLSKWKGRHDSSARMNRGLDSYLSGRQSPELGPRRTILKRLDQRRG
ncbi:MAG: hypothetical protein JST11_14090 [Acidobacteria bacterium]|nr:hypothetical protein [Acidobacteriota bacterium]